MSGGDVQLADPEATWRALSSNPNALLVDVRTQAEWTYVGVVDLSSIGKATAMIEWQSFPSMAVNESFGDMALSAIGEVGAEEVYFLCRSGVRSMKGAMATMQAAAAAGREIACFNVVEGFEGDLSADGRRGIVNGWKARGLPWRQT